MRPVIRVTYLWVGAFFASLIAISYGDIAYWYARVPLYVAMPINAGSIVFGVALPSIAWTFVAVPPSNNGLKLDSIIAIGSVMISIANLYGFILSVTNSAMAGTSFIALTFFALYLGLSFIGWREAWLKNKGGRSG